MSALHRFTFTSVSSIFVLGLGLALGPLVGCQQPPLYCSTAHGDFGATYKLKSGDPQSACGQLTADVIGLQTYYATGGLNGTPKFSESSMAILPLNLGGQLARADGLLDPAVKQSPIALADFTTSVPDDDEICKATQFSVAEISLPELPAIPGDEDVPDDPEDPASMGVNEATEEIPLQPATSIRYEWSNARVLVSANYQGTQFSADLKFTQDGCTAEYEVLGLYPLAYCNTDDECQDTSVTGINPDFDLKCQVPRPDPTRYVDPAHAPPDYQVGICVLRGDLPALK